MHKGYIRLAAWLGALSVILGAFGAHGLKKVAPDYAVSIFETGVRYQFYHVLALALAGIVWKEYRNKWIMRAGVVFVIGMAFFSGSLYLLTWMIASGNTAGRWIGAITPAGGCFLIAGWICLALGINNKTNSAAIKE